MKFHYLFLHSFVYGMPAKSCIHCKHMVVRNVYDRYENHVVGEIITCSKFATKHPVSGEIHEESARTCRSKEDLCGIHAKYFTQIVPRSGSTIVKGANANACIDCKYGAPHVSNNPFDEREPMESTYRCNKFVTTDVVSGKEETKLAMVCRNDEQLCGMDATHFIQK